MGLSCFACFDGGNKKQRREEERLASEEARAKAAEAAQKRQEQFEKSAAGRAARAQLQGMAKQSANSNKGEPVLKVLCLKCFSFSWLVVINGSNAIAVKFQKPLTETLRNWMLPLLMPLFLNL
ncbi:hypothetical protein Peur_060318 [Populus x canadensis]|uniref:Small VCP/p97-interacting protein n=1 Tax=Populus deltoides TaxID=3696 RepID=A0A8T2X5J0_POPDE|nr:hypothetical protein H0E87_023846 [Populus deltoides]